MQNEGHHSGTPAFVTMPVWKEIKYAMANERGDDHPEIAPEPSDGNNDEGGHHARFDEQSVSGSPPLLHSFRRRSLKRA